ncbi:MAG: hypothetical protein K2X93_19950 [Candidatus Obscuribacterales bacterium]|nr:hypothetical protein [Candidatus Obscuribacterales bacterium]
MKITVRLPISAEKQRKNSDDIEQAQRYELSWCGHNSDNGLEKEIAPHTISHTKESSDSEGEARDPEWRSPLDLSARTIKALMQLVEHYNDTLKEIASFTYGCQSAAGKGGSTTIEFRRGQNYHDRRHWRSIRNRCH